MLARKIMRFSANSPRFRRLLWRRWYEYLAGYRIDGWRFMNYGYAELDPEAPAVSLDPDDEPERYPIQLYHRVAGAVDLAGLDVLEVGSGRGGGASFVARHHGPASLVGVDISPKAVGFCERAYALPGLSFRRGDAEALPFEDARFDAVLNVESSHCYGSMPAFLAEVERVLRPGGHFLFADLRTPEDAARLEDQLGATSMTVLEREDITTNVIEALRLDDARKLSLIQSFANPRLLGVMKKFAAVEGSEVNEAFKAGTMRYLRYVLRK
jgi:SAM-dependent methyltransferase